jgi:Uncharacterised methyltransferase family (DUF6094)
MRLAAQAKMGYYPTPEAVTPIITKYLARECEGPIRIFDPCAGEGTALKIIGDHLQADTYGIEIDVERGNLAKDKLTKCLVTDYQNTRISHGSFSLLYLNPPYDWAAKETDIETSERYERTFLRDTIKYLCPGGILAYLIPQKRLDGHIARMLSYRFEDLSIYRFPEDEYKAFKQIIVFGRLKIKPGKDDHTFRYLKDCEQMKTVIQYLPKNPRQTYDVPVSPVMTNFIFKNNNIDPEELAKEIQQYGLFYQFREMTTPLKMDEKIRPIMPLRHGHLAQILACGLMNCVVWDTNRKNPLLVKGITKKEVIHNVEVHGHTEKHIETDHIKIMIHAWNRNGEMLTIQ